MAMRSSRDNVPFISESRSDIVSNTSVFWRSSRTHDAARGDGMGNSGMEDIEIPAFLRKSESSSDSEPQQTIVQKFMDIVSTPQKLTSRQDAVKTPLGTPEELVSLLTDKTSQNNPIQKFLWNYNHTALSHRQFRSALATCLRTNQAGYLQWLVTKHMNSAGSAAPVWAIFISWAAVKFSVQLDRHADRLLREFLKSVTAELQDEVRANLNELASEASL
jgi:hypothetical protein